MVQLIAWVLNVQGEVVGIQEGAEGGRDELVGVWAADIDLPGCTKVWYIVLLNPTLELSNLCVQYLLLTFSNLEAVLLGFAGRGG